MTLQAHQSVPLGDLVVAAFDIAARYSADPAEVARLATSAVRRILRRERRRSALDRSSHRRRGR